jgi:hypothetical protein
MMTLILSSDSGVAMKRALFCMSVVLPMLLLIAGPDGSAGGGKGAPFKPFLPADAYKEVTDRSIKLIEEAAGNTEADRIIIESAILTGYTLSVATAQDEAVVKLRGAAQQAASIAAGKDLKKLAEFGKTVKSAPNPAANSKDWFGKTIIIDELMNIFRNKSKKGEGIHADLQYHPKL